MLSFVPLLTGEAHPLQAASEVVEPDVIRVAAAFSTESGVNEFRKLVGDHTFDTAQKGWLIGIQQGITQPDALRRLAGFAASELRVPFGTEALLSPALRAPIFFHAKVYSFENTTTGEMRLLSASANLTYRGLRTSVEQFLVWAGKNMETPAQRFDQWWNDLWAMADLADDGFIDEYEARRPQLPTPDGATAAPPAAALREASSFWIELTRKPEGGSYNQAELLYNGHAFFYPDTNAPPPDIHRRLTFEDAAGNLYDDSGRRIMFNGPPLKPGGNHMWRVYLPTAAQGLTDYQDGDVLIRFQRTGQDGHYRIEIAPSRSAVAGQWIAESRGVAIHGGALPRRMGWA